MVTHVVGHQYEKEINLHRLLGVLEEIRDVQLVKLSEFWGSPLKEKPSIEFGQFRMEDHVDYTITICEQGLEVYGTRLAELAGKPESTGQAHYMGHALNHFFMAELNEQTIIYGPTNPKDSHSNKAIIEAAVNTATAWVLDQFDIDGVLLSRTSYEADKEYPNFNPIVNQKTREYFDVFIGWIKPNGEYSKQGIPDFVDFVKEYDNQKVYEF